MELYLKKENLLTDAITPLKEADVIFTGVPFDSTTIDRPGSRYGPSSIRTALERFIGHNFEQGVDIYKKLKLADAGDIETVPGSYELTRERIADVLYTLKRKSKNFFPVFIGGEHLITLPLVEYYCKNSLVVCFDAHMDLKDNYLGNKYSHVTFMRRIAEIIGKENIILVGIRAADNEEDEFSKDMDVITTKDIKTNLEKSCKKLRQLCSDREVYLSFDVDVLDPIYAQGTASPVPNGLNMEESLQLISSLKENVIGMDLTEVSPLYDSGELTSYSGAKIIYEVLSLIATRK